MHRPRCPGAPPRRRRDGAEAERANPHAQDHVSRNPGGGDRHENVRTKNAPSTTGAIRSSTEVPEDRRRRGHGRVRSSHRSTGTTRRRSNKSPGGNKKANRNLSP